MTKAMILHSVRDAEHCVKNNFHKEHLLFSTHSSVEVYLKELYDIDCQCLTRFLDKDKVAGYINKSSVIVDRILFLLDSQIAPGINKQCDLRMRYFAPLYSYSGKHHLFCYIAFVEAVKEVIDVYNPVKVSFYNYKFNNFLNVARDMEFIVRLFSNDIETELLESWHYRLPGAALGGNKNKLMRIARRPFYFINKMADINVTKIVCSRFSHEKDTILLYENLYDLKFLKKELPKKYNVLYYTTGSNIPVGFQCDNSYRDVTVDVEKFDLKEAQESPFGQIFLEDVKSDFLSNIKGYLKGIQRLKIIDREYPLSLGIWGNPPVSGFKTLIFEYLKSRNIKVLGAQHGAVYGDSFKPWHFDSDFGKCDVFISYGFTERDLERLYPDMKLETRILPLGKAEPVKRGRGKKKIDILFPITNSISMLGAGMMRTFPHKLTERQVKILEYLDSLRGLDIYIKPFLDPTHENCSVLPVLNRLKNVKIIDYLSLKEFLEIYEAKAVLLDFPSTPLFEIMHFDTEIFLLNNDMSPFEEQALEKLLRRVHYSEHTDEIIAKLDLFLNGKLEKKRDSAFYRHFVHKDNAKDNILETVRSLSGIPMPEQGVSLVKT